MELYIRYGGKIEQIAEYNCGKYLGIRGEAHPHIAYAMIAFGIPTVLLYVVCLISMTQKKQWKYTCYKIMFYLGVVDILSVIISCIMTAVFIMQGAVYCTYPHLIYVLGCCALGLWCCSCATCLVLIVNRLVALWGPVLPQVPQMPLWNTMLWLSVSTVYLIYFTFFTRAPLMHSTLNAWFFNPMIPDGPDYDYSNIAHSANNLIVVFATAFAYVCFILVLRRKYKKHGQQFSLKVHPVVLQSIIMCAFNMFASLIYVYMQFFDTSPALILFGQICWIMGHACPAYLYITLNSTIRRRVLNLLGLSKQKMRTVLPQRGTVAALTTSHNNTTNSSISTKNTVATLNLPQLIIYTRPDDE